MGYTQFYEEVRQQPAKITWKDIFSEFLKKHSKEDRQYAMLAGSAADTATEEDMLVKWRKPWLFWRFLIGGVILVLVLYLIEFLLVIMSEDGISYWIIFNILFEFLPPVIIPFVLMVFFWELNVPRNISFFQLCVYFAAGGVMSLFFTVLLESVVQTEYAVFAPLTEEPAKLAAVIVCIVLFLRSKDKRLYGMTGLVIGAAIGSGFSAFESIQYAYTSGVVENFEQETLLVGLENYMTVIQIQILRMIFSLAGHTLFCAPYAAALALHSSDSRLSPKSFLNRDFIVLFLISCLVHAFNNTGIIEYFMPDLPALILKWIIETAALWTSTLYITRKCLNQVVSAGTYVPGSMDQYDRQTEISRRPESHQNKRELQGAGSSPSGAPYQERKEPVTGNLVVRCFQGDNKGMVWYSQTGGDVLLIGRHEDCAIRYLNTPGISRKHCVITKTPQGWTVQDLNSTYGTWLGSGRKLVPGEPVLLQATEYLYLGSKQNILQITRV